jgi:hypothetical protein
MNFKCERNNDYTIYIKKSEYWNKIYGVSHHFNTLVPLPDLCDECIEDDIITINSKNIVKKYKITLYAGNYFLNKQNYFQLQNTLSRSSTNNTNRYLISHIEEAINDLIQKNNICSETKDAYDKVQKDSDEFNKKYNEIKNDFLKSYKKYDIEDNDKTAHYLHREIITIIKKKKIDSYDKKKIIQSMKEKMITGEIELKRLKEKNKIINEITEKIKNIPNTTFISQQISDELKDKFIIDITENDTKLFDEKLKFDKIDDIINKLTKIGIEFRNINNTVEYFNTKWNTDIELAYDIN